MNKDELLKDYQEVFSESGKDVFFSPGRINVIGEHTDYNGGHVFSSSNQFRCLRRLWTKR